MDRKYQNQWRNQRNFSPPFGTMQYSISNYSTDSKSKSDLAFADEMLLHNLHLIPNPLQKNLADTMASVRAESPPKAKAFVEKTPEPPVNHYYPSFTGIGSFFSGVFSVLSGGLFQRRKSVYHDCFDESPPDWQASNRGDLNKAQPTGQFAGEAVMSDCRSAVAHCEDKLNRVRLLLTNPPKTPPVSKLRRRPRKVFVEPGSVEENFQDAFTEEDFEQFGSEPHIECFSAINNHKEELMETDAPKMKTEMLKTKETPIVQPETKQTEVVKDLDEVDACKIEEVKIDPKPEVIASCEDKVSKLKALLQSRNTRRSRLDAKPDSNAEPAIAKLDNRASNRTKCIRIDKPQDKLYKNPNRGTDMRKKSQIMRNINDDVSFGTEIEAEDISSPDNSPLVKPTKLCDMINIYPKIKEHATKIPEQLHSKEYFDEVSGRFRSTSTTDSEDSFQIVFTDSPKATRSRAVSDCDSEDSFIVFEDSPDSCYTSHDVFGDSELSDDDTDSESDISDSGCGVSCKLNGAMSRTIADLTDDSLFDDPVRADSDSDDVDSAVTVCEDLPPETEVKKSTGLLIDDAKKLLRKQQPPKKVQFSTKPPKVHVMRVWAFAARQARAGHWEQHALDRDRFKRKIADVDMAVSWVLKPQHRSRVMFQRFMPWWNAQRRLEIAEKKKKEEQRKEEERVREEERMKEEERIKEEDRLKQEAERISDTDKVERIDIIEVVKGVDSMKLLDKSDFYDKKESHLVDSKSKVIIET